jgi:antitoxin FitA
MFVLLNERLISSIWKTSTPAVTIRNRSDETHRALRVHAAYQGRSTKAEIRETIEAAARPRGRTRLGSLLAAICRPSELPETTDNI